GSHAPAQRVREQYIDDFVTGTGQAILAVRIVVEYFERHPVLVDPETFALEESAADRLHEADRTTQEAEARLPRVLIRVGARRRAGSESAAVIEALREAVRSVRDYVGQNENMEWSNDSLEAARRSFDRAERHQREALDALK